MKGCWVIDEANVVHSVHCPAKGTEFLPYVSKAPHLGRPGDAQAMHEWLARPDISSGRAGPHTLRACVICVPTGEED